MVILKEDIKPGVTHQDLGLIDERRGVVVVGKRPDEYMESRLKYRSSFR